MQIKEKERKKEINTERWEILWTWEVFDTWPVTGLMFFCQCCYMPQHIQEQINASGKLSFRAWTLNTSQWQCWHHLSDFKNAYFSCFSYCSRLFISLFFLKTFLWDERHNSEHFYFLHSLLLLHSLSFWKERKLWNRKRGEKRPTGH